MTPFGQRIRELRRSQKVTQRQMAADLHVTPAYLSALEHGRRGRPAPGMVMQICAYFGLIWDDAEDLKRLAGLSHPRIVVDTGGLSPQATQLANLLAQHMGDLPDHVVEWILDEVQANLSVKSDS
ncbi:helix-turn-helix domain-containing protein [Magnetospira thiophila]